MSESSPPSKSATSFTPRLSDTRYKRGDTREDGYLFWHQNKDGRQFWYSPETFLKCRMSYFISNCKRRSKKESIPFNLTPEYIYNIFPADGICPILGCKIVFGLDDGNENSPSLDKIIPSLGYVEGNVIWVSMRANRLKSDASLDEMKRLYDFYAELQTTRH